MAAVWDTEGGRWRRKQERERDRERRAEQGGYRERLVQTEREREKVNERQEKCSERGSSSEPPVQELAPVQFS